MSWYDSTYRRRAAITVYDLAGVSTADVTITIPSDWDEFWDVIDASGYGVRITYADGKTTVPAYDVDKPGGGSFSLAGKSGRIRLDGVTMANIAKTSVLFWVYFDVASPTDGSAVVTITSALTGHIALGRPIADTYTAQPHPPGLTRPRHIRSKGSSETRRIWVDVAPLLEGRRTPFAQRACYEEPWVAKLSAYDTAGGAASGLVTEADARWVEVTRARGQARLLFLVVPVTGGSDATNYTIRALIDTQTPESTSANRRLDERFGLRVVDAIEAAT